MSVYHTPIVCDHIGVCLGRIGRPETRVSDNVLIDNIEDAFNTYFSGLVSRGLILSVLFAILASLVGPSGFRLINFDEKHVSELIAATDYNLHEVDRNERYR